MKPASSSIFIKIFLSTTLSIFISLVATSTALYLNFETIAIRQVYANDMDTLVQTGKGVASLTNIAVTLSSQIYNDLNVSRLMYYADPDAEALRSADAQLTNYRLSIPFIESVYVYNGRQDTFYVNSVINRNEVREAIQRAAELDDRYIVTLVQAFQDYRPYRPIPRTYLPRNAGQAARNYYTFLIYDAFGQGAIDHAVVINFSEEWITDFISDNSPLKNSETFILDRDGVVVSESKSYPMMSDLSDVPWIRGLLASDQSGSITQTAGGTTYLVSYTGPDAAGWRYVKLTPRDYILSRITGMKYLTILVALILLAIGFIASWLLTKRLYVPIDTLLTTLRKISLEEKKNVRLLRQVFFRDIFLGRGVYDGQTIELKLEELDTAFNAAGYFCVVLLKIDGVLAFSQEFTAVDQSLIKASLMEAFAAVVPGRANHVILDMGHNGIVAILNALDLDTDLEYGILEERLVALRAKIAEAHGLSVTLTVSKIEAGIEHLPRMYDEALEASLYRMYRGSGAIIHAREIQAMAFENYEYPSATEKRLAAALLAGKIAEAKERYDEIIASANHHPINVFNMMLSHLVFAVDDAVKTVKKCNGVDLDIGKAISVANLSNAETVEAVNAQFYSVFDEIGSVLLDRKSNRSEQLVEKIDRRIETGYMRQDLYIDSIADYLQKSSAYISHVYKQRTGTTILDKIIGVRMARAKELLAGTDLSVAEISERAGFSSSSYFFKVFRKMNGMTPNEFRENKGAPA
jgi:AraC-like DNA-binding protein